ncbi:MAG: hypothetical protein ABWK01_02455 [Infirmifilum sp.]
MLMVKKAVIEVEGCDQEAIEKAISTLEGFSESIHVETPQGLSKVAVRVKKVERTEEYWVVKVGLSKKDGWFWGETFLVQLDGRERVVRISVVRSRGVGRIHADVLGLWIVEWLKNWCVNAFPVIVERF